MTKTFTRPYTVAVTLVGRKDDKPVLGIGKTNCVGRFVSYAAAKRAALSWESDPTFVFQARCVPIRRSSPPPPHSAKGA